MTRKNRYFSVLITSALVCMAAFLFIGASKTDLPVLPGINTKDQLVNGCVDCHKEISKTRDERLNKIVSNLKNHPNIDKIVKNIPADCSMCHGKGKVPALNTITHKQHYIQPDKNVFVINYNGSCLNCHTLNLTNGEMKIKSGAKNW